MEQDTKKQCIEGELVEEQIEIAIAIPKIDSLVNYTVGELEFNANSILNFIELIKQVYSSEALVKMAQEVNELLEHGNLEAIYEKLKLAKKEPAELNNLAKDLEEELKKVKKIWNAPFIKFEMAIKNAIGEVKTITSFLKEVRVDPLSNAVRDGKFNNFTAPILEDVRKEIQAQYHQVDCNEYVFSQDPKYYNLGSKKGEIYLIAKMELDLWAKDRNESLLKVQEQARITQIIQQQFKICEQIELPEYNKKNGTKWTISDISQDLNAQIPIEEIFKRLDFETEKYIKKQEEIRKRQLDDSSSKDSNIDASTISNYEDSPVNGYYNITFQNIYTKDQFENWLGNRATIKWNR